MSDACYISLTIICDSNIVVNIMILYVTAENRKVAFLHAILKKAREIEDAKIAEYKG